MGEISKTYANDKNKKKYELCKEKISETIDINFEDFSQKDWINFIKVYRRMIILLLEVNNVCPEYDEEQRELIDMVARGCKFSGRKKDHLRQEARDFAIKQKQELLQQGKSNTEANTIVIYQLERHPIYGDYVEGLGKEALRKLLQIPQPAKEKNRK